MSNPTFEQDSIKKRKAPGVAIIGKDTSSLTEPIGIHNETAPNLIDGEYARCQLDDKANLKVTLGDSAVISDLKIIKSNVDENSTIGTDDAIPIAGEDSSGNKQNIQLTDDTDIRVTVMNDFIPRQYDYIALTYVASGNGIGEIETVTYKKGGSGGTIVGTLTITYDSNNKILTVVKS